MINQAALDEAVRREGNLLDVCRRYSAVYDDLNVYHILGDEPSMRVIRAEYLRIKADADDMAALIMRCGA